MTPEYWSGTPLNWDASVDTLTSRLNLPVEALIQPGRYGKGVKLTHWANTTICADSDHCALPPNLATWQTEDDLRQAVNDGLYSETLDPVECLTRYSDPLNDISDGILVASYDLIRDEPVANESLWLYANLFGTNSNWGFAFNWRCGQTNTFDCKSRISGV